MGDAIHCRAQISALKDSANYPTSRFIIDKDTQDWLRFIYANIGDNLPFCPAPAYQSRESKLVDSPNLAPNLGANLTTNLQSPPLPYNFILSDSWRARLLAIINTNDGGDTTAGVCGVCLLQSFQIIAELLENPLVPRTYGGYFFDTQYGANPFISFESRNSLLYQTLDDIVDWFPQYMEGESATQQEIFIYNNNLALMSAIALLPQYNWRVFATSQGQGDVWRVVDSLFGAPVGSAFLVSLRLHRVGQEGGHAMVALRLQSGVVLIPTNAPMSAEEFSAFTMPMNGRGEFLQRFSAFGFSIDNISLISAEGVYMSAFAENISLNNCTGEGDDRRGSGAMPTSALVNQCASGRCLEW